MDAKTNGEMPATAFVEFDTGEGHYDGRYPIWAQHSGLTKREAFAMAAMQGLLASDRGYFDARAAVMYADDLLAALSQEPQ